MSKTDLTKGNIIGHLVRLTIPSIGGFLAIIAFNLTDTFFVSRLGEEALAAMGFTFPVVMVTGAIASGISMGTGSVLARAMGNSNKKNMRHTATYGILLTIVIVAIVGLSGLLSLDPLFRFLGAKDESLKLVKDYMFIWYLGCIAIMMPPVCDANLRATGDMVRPFIVMLVCAIFNFILDPLLIFGIWIFPELGIQGASLATVIARLIGMCFTLFFNYKADLLILKSHKLKEILKSWSGIIHVGIPSIITQLLPSIIAGILTILCAVSAGDAGVAALAVGIKIESLPMMVAWAINMALLTVIGQNWGNKKWDRVEQTRKAIVKMAFIYAIIVILIFWPLAPFIGKIFVKNREETDVLRYTTLYLRIIFAGYSGKMLFSWTAIGLNAIGKPFWSLAMNIGCSLLFIFPGALVGHYIGGFSGMIAGLVAGQLLSGLAAYVIGRFQFRGN